jgi:hypothetical protein
MTIGKALDVRSWPDIPRNIFIVTLPITGPMWLAVVLIVGAIAVATACVIFRRRCSSPFGEGAIVYADWLGCLNVRVFRVKCTIEDDVTRLARQRLPLCQGPLKPEDLSILSANDARAVAIALASSAETRKSNSTSEIVRVSVSLSGNGEVRTSHLVAGR